MKEIFTIGHSTRSAEEFLKLLEVHNINFLADVRRFPGSRKFPWFGKDQLEPFLKSNGIDYNHFEDLGGRRPALPDSKHTEWRNKSFRGYADYMETADFQKAVERIEKIAMEKRLALMCSEAVWWRCHRSMISDYLKDRGWVVWHIMSEDKKTEHPYTVPVRQQKLF